MAAGAPVGLGLGALLVLGLRWYEHWMYGRGDALGAYGALIVGGLIGLAAWAVTDTQESAVGWVLGVVCVVHCFGGTFLSEQHALHDRGREVTVTVLTEHVHPEYNDAGERTGTTYTYDVTVPPGLPHRPLDAVRTRLAVGQRVLATLDPEGRVDSRLGGRPGVSRITAWVVRVCELLVLVFAIGLGIVGAVVASQRSRVRLRSGAR